MIETRCSLLDMEEWIKAAQSPKNTVENENHFKKCIV
jgi:hypothetical protein